MNAHVAAHVGASGVCVILVRRGEVRWRKDTPIVEGELLDEAVQRALARVPWPRRARRRVVVVCDASLCRVRELEGLPAPASPDVLSDVVRANADAFFPRVPGGLVIPDVWIAAGGRVFGAAMSRSLIDDLERAAKAAGCALVRIGPSKAVLDAAIQMAESSDPMARGVDTPVPDDASYHDALTSADPCDPAPLAWRADPPIRLSRVLRWVTCALVVAMTLSSGIAAAAAPAIRAAVELRRLRAATGASTAMEQEAVRLATELRHGRTVLDGIARLRTRHRATARLLGALSEALPESTAIVSFHIDSLDVRFVAVAPKVLEVLPAIIAVPGVADARITGSVSREITNGATVERAAFRFRRKL
jgi:hypothetical protein